MYPDPKRVRDNRLTLRFDDLEYDVITALARYQGEQPAALVRQLALLAAEHLLGLEATVGEGSA